MLIDIGYFNMFNLYNLNIKLQQVSRILLTVFFLFICLEMFSGTTGRQVNVALHWKPQAEFAGFYAAKDKGFYRSYGLDVNFVHCYDGIKAAEMLKNKEVDFATVSLVEGLTERSKGLKLVNIAQLIQKSPMLFIVRRDSGVRVPEDLNGKKIALWRSVNNSTSEAFFKKFDIKADIVPVNSGIDLFLMGGVDALIVMSYNEYHSIFNAGVELDELVKFNFSDYELDIPYTGIYCMEETVSENKVLYRKFVEATLKGWEYVFNNPEKALSITIREMKKYHEPANKAHQRWMLLEMKDLFSLKNNNKIDFKLSKKDFLATEKILKFDGKLDNKVDYKEFNKTGDI